ncbi:surfeit locus 1 family protein [Sphingomonas sp. NFR04]|uniref:SURF1 family protein n=1 Tax=Sphingomonas sp. NFR04 TaxID=1566283 RepID=UPI0008EBFF27|nr:SURF1 family protein [Sphingomonas sp. NFR04]SFK01133.1 surfeit locus 1 family protein [Sphingomonas sp. NFR04]
MRRVPPIPTLLVGLAVAAMIALGFWQLDRKTQKESALAMFAANTLQPTITIESGAADASLLFRHARSACQAVTGWVRQGGRGVQGLQGWRQIATCRTHADATLLVDMGVTRDPMFRPRWPGGIVSGTLTRAPDHRPLIASVFDSAPQPLMLVSDQGAPGLQPSAPPDIASVPNNHLAYAVQWFLFAGVAIIIYVLALRLRARGAPEPRIR